MKRCPECQNTYTDETLRFCLVDGTVLTSGSEFSETQILPAGGPGPGDPTQLLRNTPSIAVLPFSNTSADAENEYFCDGLAEEILNALAKIDDLKVAARTSTFSFKGKNANVGEIGRVLNVNSVLEGSVRKSGNRLRITVQLVNASDGYHLWSERYDREMQDIFDVQDEITLAVVDALKVKLLGAEKSDLLKRYTDNTEAYQLYLKGVYHNNKHTAEGWLNGIGFFEQAIQIEPKYAPAYAGIGMCCTTLYIFGVLSPDRIVSKWKAAVDRALEIDSRLAEAHLSSATLHFYHEWNWTEAEREYRRAIELNPKYADNHWLYGLFLVSRGRFDEAVREGSLALELDPLSLPVNLLFGWINYAAGLLEETLGHARKILELEPNFHGAYWLEGLVSAIRGEYEDAIEFFEKAVRLGGTQIVLAQLGWVYGMAGRRDQALEVLKDLLKTRESHYATAFNIARVYTGLRLTNDAFEWMEKAVEERNGELVYLSHTEVGAKESLGVDLTDDPRFQDILQRALA
jgi:serine/threonine-protein kinase